MASVELERMVARAAAEGAPPAGESWREGLEVFLADLARSRTMRPGAREATEALVVATLGALSYAMAMIWLRRIGPGESHEAVVLHFSLTGLVTMLLLSLPAWRWPDGHGMLYLLGAGLGGGGAQLAMTRAYALQRAAPVTALASLGIVFTYLLALPLFPEHPTGWQVAGSLLVILATAEISFRHDRHPARAARPGV